MDNEISKHISVIATGIAEVGAAFNISKIGQMMLGPAAGELAQMWQDGVRMYRYERQIKCVEKAERMAKEAGFTPKAVPIKILFPLLEGASMEHDETLHDMWAALLANASADGPEIVRPSFISLLKEMAPQEAQLLNSIRGGVILSRLSPIFLERLAEGDRLYRRNVASQVSLETLESAVLVRAEGEEQIITLTERGREFLRAITPPKTKQ